MEKWTSSFVPAPRVCSEAPERLSPQGSLGKFDSAEDGSRIYDLCQTCLGLRSGDSSIFSLRSTYTVAVCWPYPPGSSCLVSLRLAFIQRSISELHDSMQVLATADFNNPAKSSSLHFTELHLTEVPLFSDCDIRCATSSALRQIRRSFKFSNCNSFKPYLLRLPLRQVFTFVAVRWRQVHFEGVALRFTVMVGFPFHLCLCPWGRGKLHYAKICYGHTAGKSAAAAPAPTR